MYQASLPVLLHSLKNLQTILEKGLAYAESKKIDPSVLLHSRLAPDMRPLINQIQMVSDSAKGCAARLAGIEIPSFPDTEQTFPELQERLRKTLTFLEQITPEQLEGSETRPVTIKTPRKELHFKGQPYLLHFALPNLFFHITTAYAILRHNGVELGKPDYLGAIS